MAIEGLPIGTLYFAIRSFDASGNRGAMSNIVRVQTH
jgi:hypothetical protein